MKDDTIFIILGLILFLGLFYAIGQKSCTVKAHALGYSCDYTLFQGCVLIKPDGKRILLEQLRGID